MTNENIFEETEVKTPTEVQGNPLEALVGEGKKFKTVEDLAKGKLESDKYIESLLREQEEYRSKLEKALTVEDLYNRIEATREANKKAPTETSESPDKTQNDSPKEGLKTADIDRLVEEKLKEYQSSTKADQNLKEATSRVTAAWGENARAELNLKAKEIGISVSELQDYAKTNPSVFYRLIGLDAQVKPQTSGVPRVGVDTGKMPENYSGPIRNESYYKRLRKEDPKKYFAAETQIEMHKKAIELGEKFFE